SPGETIRWPVVKALGQFGKLTGVRAIEARNTPLGTSCLRRVDGLYTPCDLATFDLTHARYTSRYLTFANRDVFVYGGRTDDGKKWKLHPDQRLHGKALKLFDRYVQLKQRLPSDPAEIAHLPMLVIGNYLETSSSFVSGAELTATIAGAPTSSCPVQGCVPQSQSHYLSFNSVRESLIRDKNPAGNTTLVLDVNAEANVLTALICHADGKRPASVCGRPIIKKLMKLAK
ncbi:MAG TPA: hypothetical protein VFA78_00730, partial [Chloroflexota bacterium]|nr:hypothetical protein [Chloroflexota bacterium]